jgi:EmrB/QacA subfamily drug resistance transporter
MGLFAVASAGCALTGTVGWLIAWRAVQGAGAALMFPLALALLGAAFPPQARAKALGIYGGIVSFGLVLGPLVGGAVVEGISWHYAFWINVPLGLLLMVLVIWRVPESHGPDPSIDLRGLVLVTGAAFGIVWALVRGNSIGWGSAEVVGALAAGLVLAVAFVAWELRAPRPMLPMQLFRGRPFASGNASMFFFWGESLTAVFFLAQFLQTAQGYGPLDAGIRLMPWGAAMFFVAPLVGSRIRRYGERPFAVAGLSIQAGCLVALALLAKPDLPYGEFVIPLILLGAGAALTLPATQSAVMSHIAPQNLGKAAGTFSTLRQLGGALGVAVAVAVFAAAGSYASPQAFSDGFAAAMGIAAGLAFAGAIAGMFAPTGAIAPMTKPSPAPAAGVDSSPASGAAFEPSLAPRAEAEG